MTINRDHDGSYAFEKYDNALRAVLCGRRSIGYRVDLAHEIISKTLREHDFDADTWKLHKHLMDEAGKREGRLQGTRAERWMKNFYAVYRKVAERNFGVDHS